MDLGKAGSILQLTVHFVFVAELRTTSAMLFKFDGDASWDTLTEVLSQVTTDEVSGRQQDAIVEMRQKFHIR